MAVTIKDIAKLAGVSTATISKILNGKDTYISEETRRRVRSLAREYNYQPSLIARSLTTRRTNTIGIVVSDILNPYYTELVRACDDSARLRGYATIVCNSDDDAEKERSHIAFLAGHGADGIVLAVSAVRPDAKQLEDLEVPVVTMDRETQEPSCLVATIDTDYQAGAYISTQHLIAKGHSRIAFLSGSADSANTKARLAGFSAAHKKAGLGIDPSLVLCGEFQHRFGYEGTRTLLDRAAFSAICCMSDMLAIGASAALRERRIKVPADCAVMGFDNIYLASFLEHPLSTVDRRISDAGGAAINALIDHIDEPTRPRFSIVIEPTLIERATT